MTITSDAARRAVSLAARPAASARIVFIGSRRPLSRLFAKELIEQCREVLCLPSCPQDVAGVRHLGEGDGLTTEPLIALITWADLLHETIGSLATTVKAHVDAVRRTTQHTGPVTICVVPYGSLVESRHHVHELLRSDKRPPHTTGAADGVFDRLLRPLLDGGCDARVVIAPMVLCIDSDESAGYPSLLQKIVRVGRCLADEVLTKVPEYFSRYGLSLVTTASAQVNAATLEQLAAWLLRGGGADAARRVTYLESLVTWSQIGEALRAPASAVPLSCTEERIDCNALDDIFNDLSASTADLHSETLRHLAGEGEAQSLPTDGILDALRRIAAARSRPWEDSYVLVKTLDVREVAGLESRSVAAPILDEDAHGSGAGARRVEYHAGGAGPAVLLIPPFSVDVGYFAGIAREMMRDHKVLTWQPTGNHAEHLARDSAALLEMLAVQGVDELHVVAWCGGVRLTARLADDCGPRLRSMALLAPELSTSENQTEGYWSLLRFFGQIKDHTGDAELVIAQARQTWRETLRLAPSANLDQYGARATYRKSPLQYHPLGFWSQVAEDLFGDTHRILNVAQTLNVRDDANAVAERLIQYDGPILVISGTHDALIKYAGVREQCRRAGRWTLATVLGGNHYLLIEHGPTVGRLLRQFVRDGCIVPATPDVVRGGRIRVERGQIGESLSCT